MKKLNKIYTGWRIETVDVDDEDAFRINGFIVCGNRTIRGNTRTAIKSPSGEMFSTSREELLSMYNSGKINFK